MSDILIVAATEKEAAFLFNDKKKLKAGNLYEVDKSGKHIIDLLITGPGMVNTTYFLTKFLPKKEYQLAINIGICGSLNLEFKPVKILNVIKDQFGDFGAENKNQFLDVFEMSLMKPNEPPFKQSKLYTTFNKKLSCLSAISKAEGITVQKGSGSRQTISNIVKKYGRVIESMEGAAFIFVCSKEKVPCLQIRAVSNMVEVRNKEKWKIEDAVNALSGFICLLLMELESVEFN